MKTGRHLGDIAHICAALVAYYFSTLAVAFPSDPPVLLTATIPTLIVCMLTVMRIVINGS